MRITVSTVNLLNSAAAHKIAARQRTGLSTLHTPPLAVTQRPLCLLARERILTKQALQSPGHAHSSHVTHLAPTTDIIRQRCVHGYSKPTQITQDSHRRVNVESEWQKTCEKCQFYAHALWGHYRISRSVRLSVSLRSCRGYRHAGCLQLSHRRPPEMCGLRTRPRTDVDPPGFLPPYRTAIGGGISSRRPRGDTLLSYNCTLTNRYFLDTSGRLFLSLMKSSPSLDYWRTPPSIPL